MTHCLRESICDLPLMTTPNILKSGHYHIYFTIITETARQGCSVIKLFSKISQNSLGHSHGMIIHNKQPSNSGI